MFGLREARAAGQQMEAIIEALRNLLQRDTRKREAANSIANGKPSNCSQMRPKIGAFSSVIAKSCRMVRARR